jgi:hypothetical protein
MLMTENLNCGRISGHRQQDMRARQSKELRGFTAISQHIKQIAFLAGDIELTAINGMLVANKSGKASIGFSVVAHEIQELSTAIIQVTQDLYRLVYEMANLVGNGLNIARMVRILCATATCSERAHGFIFNACNNGRKKLSTSAIRIRKSADEVGLLLQRTETQCLMGIALGRMGKFEAVYGAEMAERLRQVSAEIQDRMTELLEIVKSLGTDIHEWQV